MPSVTLACPVCNFSKEMDAGAFPPPGTKVTCPVCKSVFPLQAGAAAGSGEGEGEGEDSGGGAAAAAPPRGASAGPAEPPPRPAQRTLTFCFTGNAREYFGVWIVNTLLRIVTLGLYSPWAKVRRRRYFYGNTLLDGAPFDYLADPWAILKGWLVAGLFFGTYSLTSRINPLIASGVLLVFLGVFPWVVVRSRIFNLRNSTHRNIRFGFRPDYREAYRVFLWWQLLLPFTLGIIAPYIFYRQRRFLVENSSYGTTPFRFHASAGDFYRIFLPLLVLLPLGIGAIACAGFLKGGKVALAASALPISLAYLISAVYIPTALTNLTWSSTSLGRHRFSCSLRLRDLLWIYLSNAVAVLGTLGLLAPWAAVRLLRYRLEHIGASGAGGFDAIMAANEGAVGAAPEELGDMIGFDLGL